MEGQNSAEDKALMEQKLTGCMSNLDECSRCLQTAMDVIDNSVDAQPFTVLGITADNALVSSLGTVLIAFYSTLFSLYRTNNADGTGFVEDLFNV
jgi:hypothetical protein